MSPNRNRRIPLLLRVLVRLYPRHFRERYGAELTAFYGDRFSDARARGESPIRLWRRTVADVIASAALERAVRPRLSREDRMSAHVFLGRIGCPCCFRSWCTPS